MIKIEHPQIDRIKEEYYEKISHKINLRLRFIRRVIEFQNAGVNNLVDEVNKLNTSAKGKILKRFFSSVRLPKSVSNEDIRLLSSDQFDQNINLVGLQSLLTRLEDENVLKNLILSDPVELTNINSSFNNGERHLMTEVVVNYSLIDSTLSYWLTSELDIAVCPYCNRNFINTIKNGSESIIRPDLDHFFSQRDYPWLALSFYNLIPSCKVCNSTCKGDENTRLDTHVHPYVEGFGDHAKFNFELQGLEGKKYDPKNLKITLDDRTHDNVSKIRIFGNGGVKEGNVRLFKLREIYNEHTDIVSEILEKCDENSDYYIKSIEPFLQKLQTNKKEVYRYYFGNYYEEKDFKKRPLAKLTRDIVDETGVLD